MNRDQALLDYRNIQQVIIRDCQYFDLQTAGCDLWGSPQCFKCHNYVKVSK